MSLCARIYLTRTKHFHPFVHVNMLGIFLCMCMQDWIDLVIAVSPPKEYEDEVYVLLHSSS